MQILLTGSTGFLGQRLYRHLSAANKVTSLDLKDAKIDCDLSLSVPILEEIFDLVIHAAGKAHVVPKTKSEEQLFFDINYNGTLHLLKALETHLPKSFVFISTVAVYGIEQGELITEEHPLSGTTPYALSKIQAEKAVLEWGEQHKVPILILRLPLIAANDAPGNLGQMIQAIRQGFYFRLGIGEARRSMVLAEDLAAFIPQLFQKSGIYHLTDGVHPTFKELEDHIGKHFHKKIKTIPAWAIQLTAKAGNVIPLLPINTYRLQKLQNTLTFSDAKARRELGWNPKPVVGNLW